MYIWELHILFLSIHVPYENDTPKHSSVKKRCYSYVIKKAELLLNVTVFYFRFSMFVEYLY